jgi:hypothetical protein
LGNGDWWNVFGRMVVYNELLSGEVRFVWEGL